MCIRVRRCMLGARCSKVPFILTIFTYFHYPVGTSVLQRQLRRLTVMCSCQVCVNIDSSLSQIWKYSVYIHKLIIIWIPFKFCVTTLSILLILCDLFFIRFIHAIIIITHFVKCWFDNVQRCMYTKKTYKNYCWNKVCSPHTISVYNYVHVFLDIKSII